MTTPQAPNDRDLPTEKLQAEFRATEARLKAMQARAEAQQAKEQMDEISGLTAAKEAVGRRLDEVDRQASADQAATKRSVQRGLHDLEAKIDRFTERYLAWDAARERELRARLNEAESQLKVWKGQAQERSAERGIQRHDALAMLEEKIALANARAADARQERYAAKAQAALEEAARDFDQAYAAAAKLYRKQ